MYCICFFLALSYISNKWFHFFTDLYTSSTSRKRSSTFVVSHRDWSRLEKTRLKKNRKKNSIYITGAFFWALCTIYYYLTVCPISNILLLYSNTWRINVSVWRFNEKKNVTENIFLRFSSRWLSKPINKNTLVYQFYSTLAKINFEKKLRLMSIFYE